jgi:hypothetical protein
LGDLVCQWVVVGGEEFLETAEDVGDLLAVVAVERDLSRE